MEDFSTDDFARLTLLAQCLLGSAIPQPVQFVEVNREKIFRRLLDALAQLLTRDLFDNTACSMHISPNDKDEITLVLVRKDPLSTKDRDELTKVISDIADFVTKSPPTRAFLPRDPGVGSHPDEVTLARLTFPYCLPRLLGIVVGSDAGMSSQSVIQQLDEIISNMSANTKAPNFKPHLAGRRFANARKVYDYDTFMEAHASLYESLQSFIEIAKATVADKGNDVQELYHLVLLAKTLSIDEVYVELYDDIMEPHTKRAFLSYVEQLSVYSIALRNVVAMRRAYWRIGHSQRRSRVKTIILDSPASCNWKPPTLRTLLSAHFEDHDHRNLSQGVQEAYTQQKCLPLQQHVEMRILEYYISNPGLCPIIYYIGMTESTCIMCARFLRDFKQQGMENKYNHTWRFKGESGGWEGRWIPPAGLLSRRDAEVRRCLERLKYELIKEILIAVRSASTGSNPFGPGKSTG